MSTDPYPQIEKALEAQGFDHFDWIPLKKPLSFEFYKSWIEDGQHQDMGYLETSLSVKSNPMEAFAPMQSIISVTRDYFPAKKSASKLPLSSLTIAHYARQTDYHFWLREQLQNVCEQLQKAFPEHQFLAFTDAVPLLERDHASQAGLGWIGKNTCLIHRKKGSLFFIGEILSTLPSHRAPKPIADFCGTCTRCMDACPTGALDTARQLEPKRCIAYWNIESKNSPPEDIREKMGDWFFGCDICQTTCPWNIKLHKFTEGFQQADPSPRDAISSPNTSQIEELRWVLQTSNKKLMKALGKTPLARAGGRGLKRNAMIVAANLRMKDLVDDIQLFTDDPKIGDIARWALQKIQGPTASASNDKEST